MTLCHITKIRVSEYGRGAVIDKIKFYQQSIYDASDNYRLTIQQTAKFISIIIATYSRSKLEMQYHSDNRTPVITSLVLVYDFLTIDENYT